MLTAMKMDCLVCLEYLKRSLVTAVIMAVCLILGMGSFAPIPGTIFLISVMGITVSTYSYDERSGWAAYRATLPATRRQLVAGRYVATFVMALAEFALALVLCLLVVGAASVLQLPPAVEETFAWNPEQMATLAISSCVCIAFGTFIMAISHVAALRFGMTRAIQYVPVIMCVLGVLPILVPLLFMGEEMQITMMAQVNAALESGGIWLVPGVCLLVAAVVYALSMAIGMRVYEKREL